MLVLGIDPGIAITGYGIIKQKNSRNEVLDFGHIKTKANSELPDRLIKIHDELYNLIKKYKPDAVAVEQIFFNKNAKTAFIVGQARGIAVFTAAECGLQVFEYTPLQVKQAVAGYGRASKYQVQQMTTALLGLEETPKPDDAADALAIAICHINNYRMSQLLKKV